MKPPEILGMLEEAAGTRMYESKKEAALRTLEKKQVKVEEINKVPSSQPWLAAVFEHLAVAPVEGICQHRCPIDNTG